MSEAIALGANIIVLSDRNASSSLAPIPSLLLTAAVHNHLVREKERTRVGLVVESGDAREVHHFALLIGYGAAAVNPYLALESIAEMVRDGLLGEASEREAFRNYLKAASKGVLKVMSKMGISTVASYTGAQVFEAIGLERDLVERHFGATPSRLGGVGLAELAEEVVRRHRYALRRRRGGFGRARDRGRGRVPVAPGAASTTSSTRALSSSSSTPLAPGASTIFKEYSSLVNEQSERVATLRGLLRLRTGEAAVRPPVPLEEVEARRGDHEALRHRSHVLRLDLGRGARDARHRHEPPRRKVEHR